MQTFTLNVFGLEVTFTANVDPKRVEQARMHLEPLYEKLSEQGRHMSKEKVLAFLAISVADDVLVLKEEQAQAQEKMLNLLASIEKRTGTPVLR